MKKSKPSNPLYEIGQLMTLGTKLCIVLGLFAYLGYWIDEKNESSPLFTIIFSLFGCGFGIWDFIREVNRHYDKMKNKREKS